MLACTLSSCQLLKVKYSNTTLMKLWHHIDSKSPIRNSSKMLIGSSWHMQKRCNASEPNGGAEKAIEYPWPNRGYDRNTFIKPHTIVCKMLVSVHTIILAIWLPINSNNAFQWLYSHFKDRQNLNVTIKNFTELFIKKRSLQTEVYLSSLNID